MSHFSNAVRRYINTAGEIMNVYEFSVLAFMVCDKKTISLGSVFLNTLKIYNTVR